MVVTRQQLLSVNPNLTDAQISSIIGTSTTNEAKYQATGVTGGSTTNPLSTDKTTTYPTYTKQQVADTFNLSQEQVNTAAPLIEKVNPNFFTPETLAPTEPFPVQSPNLTPVYDVSGLQVPELQPTAQEQKASDISQELGKLYDSYVGKSAYQSQQEEKFGVNQAQATIQDLSAQLTGLKNEAAAIPLQLQQGAAERGVTTTQLGRQENSRLRTNAIAALGVSTLLSAAQGQLANAQALADRAVAQKYDPILEKIAAKQANLELILNDPLTSLQDRNRALQQQAIQDQIAQQTQLAKQNESEIWGIATTAASNGGSFTPSGQYTNLALTLQAISQAPTKEQALQIAVQTGLVGGVSSSGGTASIQEYNLARSQGYTGTFLDYQNSVGGSSGGLTPGQINSTVNSIAGAFDNEPIVKSYNTAQEGYQTIKSIGVNTGSPADDIAFIYAFAKIMDPNSVVREGEYNTIQRYAQSWAQTFGFNAQRIFSNTNFLSADAKQKMLDALSPKIDTITAQYENLYSEYQRQIDSAYLGEPRQLTDYSGAFTPTGTTQSTATIQPTATQTQPTVDGWWGKILNYVTNAGAQ